MPEIYRRLVSGFVIGILVLGNISILLQFGNENVTAETPFSDSNLVLYYSFDNNHYDHNWRTVRDDSSSGNVLDGNQHNNANFTGKTPYGLAMNLSSKTQDYIDAPPHPNLNITTYLTIEAWIFLDRNETNKTSTIVSHKNGYWFYVDGNNYLCFENGTTSAQENMIVSQHTIPLNKWTHVAVTRGGGQYPLITLYINGYSENCTTNICIPPGQIYNTFFGCWGEQNNKDHFFNGIIDEIKIWKWRLTPSDGLGNNVLKLGFEEGAGSTTYDRSGNDFIGKIYGAGNWDANGMYESRCYHFVGHNQNGDNYIIVQNNYLLSIQQDLTIEAWIYWSGGDDIYTIAFNNNNYWFYIACVQGEGDAKLFFDWKNNNCYDAVVSNSAISANKWTHVAVTRSGNGTASNSIKLYINGNLDTSDNNWDPPAGNNSSDLYIGSREINYSMDCDFIGKMDNLLIYNYVKEIQFQVLRYDFEGDSNSWLHDKCIYYDHVGTPYGGPYCEQAQIANSFGYSIDANGSRDYHYGHSLHLDSYGSYVDIGSFSELSISDDLTIEARVKLPTASSGTETIVSNNGNYWLGVQVDSPQIGVIKFGNRYDTQLVQSSPILFNQWQYITILRAGNGTSQDSIRIYLNGVLEAIGNTNIPTQPGIGHTYIGCMNDGYQFSRWFRGYLDNIVIYNSTKSVDEDTDCDGMPDVYEMIRSNDTNQYNPIEYNGRYAILCAPIRQDSDMQFKYDIDQMRYYLVANGWCDCDIIFLTCENNQYRSDRGFTLSETHAELWNGNWIDGEAYHDNLGNAFTALINGGGLSLRKSSTWNNISFGKTSPRDTLFIEFKDHGTQYTHQFRTYNFTIEDDPWSAINVGEQLNNTTAKYIILELDICYCTGWLIHVNGTYRAIMMAGGEQETYAWEYLFYARMSGYVNGIFFDHNNDTYHNESEAGPGNYYSPGGLHGNNETANADGVTNFTTECVRNPPTNAIISLQEIKWYAIGVVDDRYDDVCPIANFGSNIPSQMYI
jgi:hypothetical protein